MGNKLEDFKAAHDPTHDVGDVNVQYSRDIPKTAKTFIIVAAQNATPVDRRWWGVIKTMALFKQAEILVLPVRYKNPTSQWTGSQRNEEYWVDEVRPYLWNVRKPLNKNLMVLGDIKIQPTASSPLTGADALSLASSGIIGHTKLQMKTVPTPSNRMAKILTTTGACTVANYTDSRAGRIGEFHHSLSAVVVEIDGSKFYLRHVHFDRVTGTATDLDTRYSDHDTCEPAPRPLALVMGDTHVRFIDPKVHQATWGDDGMVRALKPQHVVWHDTLDSYSCTPHHEGNPFIAEAKQQSGFGDVKAEVDEAADYIQVRAEDHPDIVHAIVPSNHDDMLSRWIKRADWKTSASREFYLETALAMVRGTKMGPGGAEYPDAFSYWLKQRSLPNVKVLDRDESFVLGGVELGMHGDAGPNGARGSRMNLRRIGIRSIIGHSHQCGIEEGCYQTGTSTRLRLEYNHGPSGWLNAHVLLHADGKRQVIIFVDGKWHA